jgi:hypothetical protein
MPCGKPGQQGVILIKESTAKFGHNTYKLVSTKEAGVLDALNDGTGWDGFNAQIFVSGSTFQWFVPGNQPRPFRLCSSAELQPDAEAGAKSEGGSASNTGTLVSRHGANGGKGAVEALPTDRLKTFLPTSLDGLARTEMSAKRSAAMGIQVSEAEARYSDNAGQTIRLKVADLGGAGGLAALAPSANVEEERHTPTGYEKTYKSGGRMINEQWDGSSRSGQYTVIVGERFSVEASGNAASIDVLKSAVNRIDLEGLEALRNEGVKVH